VVVLLFIVCCVLFSLFMKCNPNKEAYILQGYTYCSQVNTKLPDLYFYHFFYHEVTTVIWLTILSPYFSIIHGYIQTVIHYTNRVE